MGARQPSHLRRRLSTVAPSTARCLQLGRGARGAPAAGTCSERWDEDRLIFEVGAMGQTISGVVDVLDDAVKMQIELPGMLGLIAGALKNRLQRAGQLLLK